MTRRSLLLLSAALLLLALVLRVLFAGATPLHPDEIHYAWDALEPSETATLHALRDVSCAMTVERRTAHPMAAALLTRWLWVVPFGGSAELTPSFLRGLNVLLGLMVAVVAAMAGRAAGTDRRGAAAGLLVLFSPAMIWISATMYLDPLYTLAIAAMVLGVAEARRRPEVWPVLLQGLGMGLAAATKISSPVLVPAFLAGLAFGHGETPWRVRALRGAAAAAMAAAVAFLFSDPSAYYHAIVHPTDPRYRATWEQGGLSNYVNMAFVYLNGYVVTALWDGPLTLVLAGGAAAVMGLRRRDAFEAWLVLLLACMSPLLLMHMNRLSGPHGFMPIHLVLCLLASGLAEGRGRGIVALAVGHFALCAAALGVRATHAMLPLSTDLVYPARDARFDVLRPWLYDRAARRRIVVLDEWTYRPAWILAMRNAQLAEGAIFLSRSPAAPPTDGLWDLADVVVATEAMAATLQSPGNFEARPVTIDTLPYVLFVRTEGEAVREIPVDWLSTVGDGRRMLPGNVYPVTGHLLWRDERLLPGGTAVGGVRFFGREDFATWGDGTLELAADAPDGWFAIAPPERADVFWKF